MHFFATIFGHPFEDYWNFGIDFRIHPQATKKFKKIANCIYILKARNERIQSISFIFLGNEPFKSYETFSLIKK